MNKNYVMVGILCKVVFVFVVLVLVICIDLLEE